MFCLISNYFVILTAFFCALGLLDAGIEPAEARNLLGGGAKLFRMNDVFGGDDVPKYRLLLPEDLKPFYDGKGFGYNELNWISDKTLYVKEAEQVPLEEVDDQKSSVFWQRELEQLKKQLAQIDETLGMRRKQVSQAEKERSAVKKQIEKTEDMLQVAKSREELFIIKGDAKQKLKQMNMVKLLWSVVNDETRSDEDVKSTVLNIRKDLKENKPGPSRLMRTNVNPVKRPRVETSGLF